MRGHAHVPIRSAAHLALAGSLLLALLPAAAAGAEEGPMTLPRCGQLSQASSDGFVAAPWRAVLDGEGVVKEHRMTLRRDGVDSSLRAGRRGFAVPVGPDRVLLGERLGNGTDLTMIDVGRTCRLWTRRLDRLAYPPRELGDRDTVRLTMHEPATRQYEGTLLLDVESGASGGIIDGDCITDCLPNDGEVLPAALELAGGSRPVPNFAAGGWPQDKKLRFRWGSGAAPPTWARAPLKSAAGDARRTSRARSPRFVYGSDASNAVRYGGTFPDYCGRNGIACAARSMPTFWGVWLRPHGTDFAWGSLRWCQKKVVVGCFDIRRVLLHELGHITGLHHPSTAGFTLSGQDSVMQAVTPDKPKPGSTRHAFGRCDVATLQELYDTPDNKTAVSDCNHIATSLVLSATRTSVNLGGSVTFTAELRAQNRSNYRLLAANPLNGRSVKLKYRRANSGDGWSTVWMRSLYSSGRYELTIAPQASWEFKATFPAPPDEGLRFSRSEIVKVKVTS